MHQDELLSFLLSRNSFAITLLRFDAYVRINTLQNMPAKSHCTLNLNSTQNVY